MVLCFAGFTRGAAGGLFFCFGGFGFGGLGLAVLLFSVLNVLGFLE